MLEHFKNFSPEHAQLTDIFELKHGNKQTNIKPLFYKIEADRWQHIIANVLPPGGV